MSINWNALPPREAKAKLISKLQTELSAAKYGFGPDQWNLTEIIQNTDDPRHVAAYRAIEGVNAQGKREMAYTLRGTNGQPFMWRLHVLSRQACCKDKAGHKIWIYDEARRMNGESDDIVALKHDEKPQPGDVLWWKGQAIPELTSNQRNAMVRRGESLYNDIHFTLDDDCCIWVGWPYVLEMLSRKGHRLTFPEFRRRDRRDRSMRRITNWWFKEVPHDFQQTRKKTKRNDNSVITIN